MRARRFLTTISSALMLAGMPALATLAAQSGQSPQVKVDVSIPETHTVWYADPVWIAIGCAVFLLLIVLAVMASRGREPTSTTTVVR